MRPPRNFGTWFPIAAFVSGFSLPLLVYCLTLAPGLTWAHGGADGGDLIVAAYSLGVSHPPGYPAYTLLAHLFTILPWGSVAFRVNLLSATGAAFAAGLVALNVSALSTWKHKWDALLGAAISAWTFAFIPLFWKQAVITEVYTSHAAFVALIILLALRLNRCPTIWAAWALGLAWGISFGFHLTSIFLLPIIMWGRLGPVEKKKTLPLWGGLLLGFGIASLQWLYLALRSGHGAVTWGNPTTLAGWWWLVSGSLYKDYVFSLSLEDILPRLLSLVRLSLTGFGPIAIFFGLIGWEALTKRHPWLTLNLGITALSCIIFAIGYNTTDSDNYTITSLVIFCIATGYGISYVADDLRTRGKYPELVVGWIMIFTMLALNVILQWPNVSLKADREAMSFGEKVMQAAPASAILLTNDDRATFSLWYFRYVLGRRADTLIIDQGLLAFDWYRTQLEITPEEAVGFVQDNEFFSSRLICQVMIGEQSPKIECIDSR